MTSNIFAERTQTKSKYDPVHNYKVKGHHDYWHERKEISTKTGDSFFKRSERYKANPDFAPTHVGMPWSIVDASDYVRPSALQMADKYKITQGVVPLHKAYNTFESPALNYEQRMDNYTGPMSPQPGMQSNGFKSYINSGGISKKHDLS